MIEVEQVRIRLEELGILQGAVILDACLERAAREKPTYIGFLNNLLGQEIQHRQQRNLEVRTKLSHLPYRKTLDEFDFSFQPTVDERLMRAGHDELYYASGEHSVPWSPRCRQKPFVSGARYVWSLTRSLRLLCNSNVVD